MNAHFTAFGPCPMLCPVPAVLVSCRGREPGSRPNLITVAWAGTVCSKPPMISISLKKERYSYGLIAETGEFAVNLVPAQLCRAMDFCGVKSGRDVDKFSACGLTACPAPSLSYAPYVKECPAHLSCLVERVVPLGSHDLFLARVVQVEARSSLVDESGTLHLEQAGLVCYNHGLYQRAGEALGFFGYSVAAPKALEKRMNALRNSQTPDRAAGKRRQGGR